jgi:hypothetical protein
MVFACSLCCEAHHTPRFLRHKFPNPERSNPVWGPRENGIVIFHFGPSTATGHAVSCHVSLKISLRDENIGLDLLPSIDA